MKSPSTKGQIVRSNIALADNILRGNPTKQAQWQNVAKLLRAAADHARAIAKLAGAMEG